MSRTGVEAKLPWRNVPKAVRQQVESTLGAPVRRAARIWGGYSPAPTFRLALADGQRAFFKATYAASNEFSTAALWSETRVYAELSDVIGPWMPQFYAELQYEDWHGLLLEDLGPKSAPPWKPGLACKVVQGMAAFHTTTLAAALPAWLARPASWVSEENWAQTVAASAELTKVAAMAGAQAAEALRWLQLASPTIVARLDNGALLQEPFALLHGDLRSDNLRFTRNRLYLFDWPAVMVGRPELDLVAFAQSVTVEGGPAPEQILAWYGEKMALDHAAVDSALAWCISFFARRAWEPEIPGLPRVRRFQRQQLAVLLQWAARAWELPEPKWAARLKQE